VCPAFAGQSLESRLAAQRSVLRARDLKPATMTRRDHVLLALLVLIAQEALFAGIRLAASAGFQVGLAGLMLLPASVTALCLLGIRRWKRLGFTGAPVLGPSLGVGIAICVLALALNADTLPRWVLTLPTWLGEVTFGVSVFFGALVGAVLQSSPRQNAVVQ